MGEKSIYPEFKYIFEANPFEFYKSSHYFLTLFDESSMPSSLVIKTDRKLLDCLEYHRLTSNKYLIT
jgi:hypothetical protein